MISNSFPEYVFIRICIAALRAIAPLSLVYTLASWYEARFLYSRSLGLYALAEACFYVFVYLPRSFYLQKASLSPSPAPRYASHSLLRTAMHGDRRIDIFLLRQRRIRLR